MSLVQTAGAEQQSQYGGRGGMSVSGGLPSRGPVAGTSACGQVMKWHLSSDPTQSQTKEILPKDKVSETAESRPGCRPENNGPWEAGGGRVRSATALLEGKEATQGFAGRLILKCPAGVAEWVA